MRKTQTTRRGFSLIELLVVMVIIGILAVLGVAVWGGAMNTARARATEATIAKIDNFVRERMQALDRNVGNRAYENEVISTQSSLRVSKDLAQTIVVKRARRAIFPQFLYDANSTDPNEVLKRQVVAANPALRAILDKFRTDSRLPAFNAANHNRTPESRATESSELLHYILTYGDALGVPPVGEDQFDSSEVADTDQDGRKEFVDAWGRPLRFYVYPTRLVRPNGVPWPPSSPWPPVPPLPQPPVPTPTEKDLVDLLVYGTRREVLQQDADDPKGVFGTWLQTGFRNRDDAEVLWHTPYTYHVPLIVSAGQDGVLGLYEPHEIRADAPANRPLVFGHLARPKTDTDGDGTDDWSLTNPNEGPLNDDFTNYQQGGK